MKNNIVTSTKSLSIQDFFKIYPDIIPKNENFEVIHKFYDLFKKPLLKDDIENNSKQLTRSLSKVNIPSSALLGFSLNQKIRKININLSKENSKKESTDSFQNEQKEIEEENKGEYNYFLIQKAIFLQNKKKKRTNDVKKALEFFLFNSSIIEKLTNNLSVIATTLKKSKKFTATKKNEGNNQQEEEIKIGIKLNTIVLKLAERVLVKKYPKNKFVIKMNEIGEDCYFLISGKLSILKPVEYKLKLTYKDYFIYLKNLMDLNEIDLLQQVLNVNRTFLDITNIKEVTRLIKVYFAHTLKLELDKKVNGITLKELEAIFKEFNYSFEDFKINKEKMMKEIKANVEVDTNVLLRNYINDNISMSTEDLFLLDLHNIVNIEKERKAPLVNLFRYEIFLFLYPGSFFGDAALENTIKKRNASIRCEEDCIICSLSNLYYSSLIAEENKKLKIIDLQFLMNNFFFKEISPNIFNKYYYPMFKISERKRKNIVYKSNEKLSSVYLLKDGIIKTEIYANIHDLMNLIKKIIKGLYLKSSNLKITLEQIMDLKKNYLKDEIILESVHNKDQIISDKQPKQTYNLYYSNGFECLGLLEYCLNLKFLTTCTIISDKAILMEIQKEDLSRILQNEREIVPSFYNFVHMNALSLTKRLYFLKSNLLNKLVNDINEKQKDTTVVTLNNSTNNHKPKIEIINSDKVKSLYNPKIKKIKDKFGGLSTKKVNVSNRFTNINTKKNNISSNITEKNLIKEDSSLFGKEYYDIGRSLHTKRDNKNTKKFILKQNENEKNIDKNISVVNIMNKILTINLIKKGIVKEFAKKKNLEKLNIVSNFHQEDEKSFIDEIIGNKYINEKNRSLGSDEEKSPSKESFTNYYKNINIKGNEYKTIKKESPSKSPLPNIKYSEQKIKNLIKEMKRNYNMNNGQTKFVFYRKSKANKVYDNLMREKNSSLSGQKSARNIIKDYYLKKKIGGYSSIVNPSNNTYINRQKTFKVKTSRANQKK